MPGSACVKSGRGPRRGSASPWASPLLVNLSMRRFVQGWKQGGHEQRLEARIINFAYGFVVCCKPGRADAARTQMQSMMERLRPPHPLGVSKSVNIYFQVASLAVGDTFQASGWRHGRSERGGVTSSKDTSPARLLQNSSLLASFDLVCWDSQRKQNTLGHQPIASSNHVNTIAREAIALKVGWLLGA